MFLLCAVCLLAILNTMKTVLVVFTGTGNTLKVARDLAAALPEETEIIRLSHRSFPEEIRADKVIILYPVYCFGLPAMVHGWLGLVRFPDNPLVYGVATYGGLLCAAGIMLKKRIQTRGFRFSGHFAVHMPGNCVSAYDIAALEKRNKMFAKEAETVEKIAEVIGAGKKTGVKSNLGLLGRLMTARVYPAFMKDVHQSAKRYEVTNACTGCKLCTEVCPAGNIWMEDARPVFGERCEGCYACLHLCPVACIQDGPKTASRARYHQPEVQVDELTVYSIN